MTTPLDELPKQHKFNPNSKFSQTETQAIGIGYVEHEPGKIISPIFVREKQDAKFRLFLTNLLHTF